MIIVGYCIAFLLICIATYTDIKKYQIPNILSLLPYILGVMLYSIRLDFKGVGWATINAILVFFILILLYIAKGLGAGDVKFISGLSFLIETKSMWNLLFLSFCTAGVIAILIFSFRIIFKLFKHIKYTLDSSIVSIKDDTDSLKPRLIYIIDKINALKQIPFMIAVLPAYIIVLYLEVVM